MKLRASPRILQPQEATARPAKAYQALSEGGALIVYDPLIEDDRQSQTHGLRVDAARGLLRHQCRAARRRALGSHRIQRVMRPLIRRCWA